ncbi:hypothetical protein L2E82_34949 [Cichorium intybus]|uniref:Uncharacterized protein n=1 Tax=Cichorium intybus TaxID=13427 RepID=A0ACB9BN00_CICIN|nr:hypothetical protein L2E82_34949 [Cichorium intybus]
MRTGTLQLLQSIESLVKCFSRLLLKILDYASNFSGLTGWDYRENDDHYTLADLTVVVAVVLFVEVPDLGSIVAVVAAAVEPILLLHPHSSAQPPGTGIAVVEVVVDMVDMVRVERWFVV